MLYLMRRMAIVVISRAVTIPKATETDGEDAVTLPGDLDDDNGERSEQRTSMDRMLGGGLSENRGGGGGSWEQC